MLKNTFLHIPGISPATEELLWKNDILTWEDAKANLLSSGCLPRTKSNKICECITKSEKALINNDFKMLSLLLDPNEHWRAYKEFKDKVCFLDIETTGLSKHRNKITTIGIYDGKKPKILVRGKDLDNFEKEINKYSMIVTFNGRMFDIPFLKANFPNVKFNHFHFDLRFALAKLGYKGGLKKIEQALGITRDKSVQGVDGYQAVRLWKAYEKGNKDALKTLIKYNTEDIVNLKYLAEFTYEKLREINFLEKI